jgi:hypothetical protein
MIDPEQQQQYLKDISEMYDEAKGLIDGFEALFSDDSVGELKYLFTLHCMMVQVCEVKGIPPQIFHEFVPSLVAVWHVKGKPDVFDFATLAVRPDKGRDN